MKMTLLGIACFGLSTLTFSQHNYMITSPGADATFIRDAEVVDGKTLLCALDLRHDRDGNIDIIESGMVSMDISGKANWSALAHVEGSEKTLGFDAIHHPNGDFYFHGMTIVDYQQYGFVLRVDASGKLVNSSIFHLGTDISYAINKMKIDTEGNLILSMYSGDALKFVALSPEGKINWSTGLSTSSEGTGKQPGYDFQLTDDGLIAVGKRGSQFSILELSKSGEIKSNYTYSIGDYSLAKTVQVLDDGNILVTGDYLKDINYHSFIAKIDGTNGMPLWVKCVDQFDGTFHYQQTELVDNEIHWSLMGNNNPSMMDPEFFNYYMRLDYNGDVLNAYRNGEKYDLADYQRLMRADEGSVIYGSAYNDKKAVGGLVHSYETHEFDPCYWSELNLTTSPSDLKMYNSFSAPMRKNVELTNEIQITLKKFNIKSEGTCEQVWEESTELEEENAVIPDIPAETVETIVENDEFARENHENLLAPEHEFTVFPNPNRGVFTIRTDYLMVDVVILDQAGKVVYQGVAENGDTINLSDHPTGVYIMKIITETDNFIRRVVIQ